MIGCPWIVCERDGRWATALRSALERHSSASRPQPRLREVRSLAELADELALRPTSIAAMEVHRGNFGDVLAWLAAAEQSFPRAGCVALCDRSLAAEIAADALREAGALEVARSPRLLRAVIDFGRRHESLATKLAIPFEESETRWITAEAWSSLPWQDA